MPGDELQLDIAAREQRPAGEIMARREFYEIGRRTVAGRAVPGEISLYIAGYRCERLSLVISQTGMPRRPRLRASSRVP